MKNIFLIICLLLYSTNLFSNTSSSDSDENKYIQEENNHTQIAFGALLRALTKMVSKFGKYGDNVPFPTRPKFGDDILTPKFPKFKPTTPIKISSQFQGMPSLNKLVVR